MFEILERINLAGVRASILLAGFVGSVISVMKDKDRTIETSVLEVMAGCAVAFYITDIIIFFVPELVNFDATIGFILGLSGMNVIDFIINAGDNIDVKGFLKKYLPFIKDDDTK